MTDRLLPNTSLHSGEALVSPNGRYHLNLQTDGNLVIHNADDRPIWGAGSFGHEGAKLVLRADAKVVVMDGNSVVWST